MPTSRIFDTLKHREQDPERVYPEVPRGGRAQGGSENCLYAAGLSRWLARATASAAEAQTGTGNAPRRMNPKRARGTTRGEIRRRYAPTGRGIKPLKRGRCGSDAHAPKAQVHVVSERDGPFGSATWFRSTSRSSGRPISEGATAKARQASVCHGGRRANRKRGSKRREACAISARSCSEGSPRKRAWLKRYQGVRRGSKASRHMVSARTQRDPGRLTPGLVDLDGWMALGGEKPRESACAPVIAGADGVSGHTLKWSSSLRKVTTVQLEPGASASKTARWNSEPRGGSRQTNEALERRDVFGRQVNHTRGARSV